MAIYWTDKCRTIFDILYPLLIHLHFGEQLFNMAATHWIIDKEKYIVM